MSPYERRLYNLLPSPLRAVLICVLDLRDLLALGLNRGRHW